MKNTLIFTIICILFLACVNEKSDEGKSNTKPLNKIEDSLRLEAIKQNDLIKSQKELLIKSVDSTLYLHEWLEKFKVSKKDVKTIDKIKNDEFYQEVTLTTYNNGITHSETIYFGDDYVGDELFIPNFSIEEAKKYIMKICLRDNACSSEKEINITSKSNGVVIKFVSDCYE
jgi:hypothetical protein